MRTKVNDLSRSLTAFDPISTLAVVIEMSKASWLMSGNSFWPDLPLSAWNETCETLHRWTQIAGKVRLASTPLVNHWWNVTLYVNSRGLVAPANCYASRTFDIVFDFVDHQLRIATSD